MSYSHMPGGEDVIVPSLIWQEEAQHHHANKEEHKQDAAQHKDGAGMYKNLNPVGHDAENLERTLTLICNALITSF